MPTDRLGIAEYAANDEEVALVLAHEIGHSSSLTRESISTKHGAFW